MSVKVSVITPVYNREKTIEECISSVLAQSYQDFELILLDDGSSDNSLFLCKALSEKDSRIKLFECAHQGVSAARNTALEKAEGEYIFFLDSDDYIHPNLLEVLVNAMEQSNAMLGGSRVIYIPDSKWQERLPLFLSKNETGNTEYVTNETAINAIFRSTTPLNLLGGTIFRRSYIKDTKFDTRLFIGEDFYFIYQNLIKGGNCVFLKEKWYFARSHSQNISKDFTFEGFYTRFYRRILVAESEERLLRYENADIEKREALSIYVNHITKAKRRSLDAKKMKNALKPYLSYIKSAFKSKKYIYYLSVFAPFLLKKLLSLKSKYKGK